MSGIPLHIQRRFEQRWAARFGPLKRTTPPSGVSSLGGVTYFKLPSNLQQGFVGADHAKIQERIIGIVGTIRDLAI
jgi:hypothetical protein